MNYLCLYAFGNRLIAASDPVYETPAQSVQAREWSELVGLWRQKGTKADTFLASSLWFQLLPLLVNEF